MLTGSRTHRLAAHVLALAVVLAVPVATSAGDNSANESGPRIVAGKSPPSPRIEIRPPQPGPGHVWVPGHWHWRNDDATYSWVAGYWKKQPRPRAVWIPGRWQPLPGGGWEWQPGHWKQ